MSFLSSHHIIFVVVVCSAGTAESEVDRKKREREEKRLQRQKELQEKREARKGGALKLGAKRVG